MKRIIRLSKEKRDLNKYHIMNYTYSYFAGILAAVVVASMIGQFKLILNWYFNLLFLVASYAVGLFCCTIIFSPLFYGKNKK